MELENVELAPLVETVVSAHSLPARAKMMHTDVDLKATACLAEPMLLMSVLDNLYSNAVHYGAESGNICLRSSLHGARVYIDVINTGTPLSLIHICSDADIWLITGSPQPLIEAVYFDTPWLPRVNLIASQIQRGYGGWVLTMRCLGHEKVAQLERKIGTPLRLYSGYSDSNQDNPLLYFCQHRWRVTPRGELQQLE